MGKKMSTTPPQPRAKRDLIDAAAGCFRRLHRRALDEGNESVAAVVNVAQTGLRALELRRAREEIDRKLAELERAE